MTAAVAAAAFTPSPSTPQLRLSGYDRRELTAAELTALRTLGPLGLRRSRARGATQRAALWAQLTRLVGPIDDARSLLHHPDDVRYRRASTHAAGLVLQHCADTGRVYWSWTQDEW